MSSFGTHSPSGVGNKGSPAEADSPKRSRKTLTYEMTAHAGQMSGCNAAEAGLRLPQEHRHARRTPLAW
eukprot:9997386-Lingulodinium_polyedra.AAC.1